MIMIYPLHPMHDPDFWLADWKPSVEQKFDRAQDVNTDRFEPEDHADEAMDPRANDHYEDLITRRYFGDR